MVKFKKTHDFHELKTWSRNMVTWYWSANTLWQVSIDHKMFHKMDVQGFLRVRGSVLKTELNKANQSDSVNIPSERNKSWWLQNCCSRTIWFHYFCTSSWVFLKCLSCCKERPESPVRTATSLLVFSTAPVYVAYACALVWTSLNELDSVISALTVVSIFRLSTGWQALSKYI